MKSTFLVAASLVSLGTAMLALPTPAKADNTPECNTTDGPSGPGGEAGDVDDGLECGIDTSAPGERAVALGNGATAEAWRSIAIGEARVLSNAQHGLAIGDGAWVSGIRAVAVGSAATAEALNSVALGYGSYADEANTVSIGSAGNERRLVNLAAGVNDTDAVTVAQLNAATGTPTQAYFIANSTRSGAVASGTDSIAVGGESRATGQNSIAMGVYAIAEGTSAIALGFGSRATGFLSSAYGNGSFAAGERTVAFGAGAQADGARTVAIGVEARSGSTYQPSAESVAIGYKAETSYAYSIALGANAKAVGNRSIAIGGNAQEGGIYGAFALRDDSIAIGVDASVYAENSIAIGNLSFADQPNTVAFGHSGNERRLVHIADGIADTDAATVGQLNSAISGIQAATGANAAELAYLAVSSTLNPAQANGSNATALGGAARANGTSTLAVGALASAQADRATAIGSGAMASGTDSIALGRGAAATDFSAAALGTASLAENLSTAVGYTAKAQGLRSTAIGSKAEADKREATAVGANAKALFSNSTAIGANAITTAGNQVMLGGAGSSVVVADMTSSTAAQSGTLYTVTVDENGVLGRGTAISMQTVARMAADILRPGLSRDDAHFFEDANGNNRVSGLASGAIAMATPEFDALTQRVDNLVGRVDGIDTRLGAVETRVAQIDSRLGTAEGQITELFDLATADRRDFRQGLAAVAAMANPHFPSEDGKTSYASNVALHRGFVGISAGLMHRVDETFALSAGITYGGGDSTTVKAGIAGEF
ncbi:hypothetical protein [Qipengyuania flava]|uniref:hypothetical protein n=1 Tax=Qipengyuania flava TaxID=192812 RepID=UPI001C62702B|nr:hypothetical protein [Qipengyuania flava]QYJ07032.1 hypothetical protein KUV82_13480 [Qipengyuania flava]